MAKRTVEIDEEEVNKKLSNQQKTYSFDTKEFTLELLVSKFNGDEIEVPFYQREYVWDNQTRCNFIESLLLGLPIPYLLGADTEDGKIELIDGVQRINTVAEYLSGDLVLDKLEKISYLNKTKFDDLPDPHKRRLKNRTLRITVLSQGLSAEDKQYIFKRINTGSMRLNPAEQRKGSVGGKFYNFIAECANSDLFTELCPLTKKQKDRQEGEERILRFFAYSDRYKDFEHLVYEFLDKYLLHANGFSKSVMAKKKTEFENMLNYVNENFPNGFFKKRGDRTVYRVRFEAIAVGTCLALRKKPNLGKVNMDWLDSKEFLNLTTSDGSNNKPKVIARIEYVRNKLLGE